MKRELLKKPLTFSIFILSLIKWLILSVIAGVIVGAAAAGFIWILNFFCNLTAKWDYYFLLLPAAFFLSALIIRILAPDAEGHGTEKAIKAVNENNGKVKIGVVPVKLVTTVITISCGGSAGKEGPATQIGAGLASFLSSVFKLNPTDSKRLVICGMSAAFSAIFGTPVAAAVFALEVLMIGKLELKNLFPVFVASIAGYFTSQALNIGSEAFPALSAVMSVSDSGTLVSNLLLSLGSGAFFGAVALVMILSLKYGEKLSGLIKIFKPLKGPIGGAFLVALVFIFGSSGRNYLGMGIEYFTGVMHGEPAKLYDFLLKIVFTAVTLSFGGSGGILTPLFFIGATSGSAFAGVFGLDAQVFAALGMLAVLAGATNTPLACTIMALELFGADFAIMAAIACAVSYIITGHRSVYPTQRLAASKVTSVHVNEGEDLEHVQKQETVLYSKWLGFIISKIKKNKDVPAVQNSTADTNQTDKKDE